MADAADAKFAVVRAAFEDAMRVHYPHWSFASDGCGGYHNERTELAWQGWMACFLRLTAPGVMPSDASRVQRLRDAVEGECDGLSIDERHARAILEYVDGVPACVNPQQENGK